MNRVLWWLVLLANIAGSLGLLAAVAYGQEASIAGDTPVAFYVAAIAPLSCFVYLGFQWATTRNSLVAAYIERKTLEQKKRSAELRQQMGQRER